MLLHCIINVLKLDSTKRFFQRSKQVEITWCQIWTLWRMCKYLPIRLSDFLCGLMSPLRGAQYPDENLHLVEADYMAFLQIVGCS